MKHLSKTSMTIFIALLVTLAYVSDTLVTVSTSDQASQSLVQAERTVGEAVNAVLNAEAAGANVTGLLTTLNQAATLLAQAEEANRTGDANAVTDYAGKAASIASQVNTDATNTKAAALISARDALWIRTIIIASVFLFVLFLVWRRVRRSYINSLSDVKPEVKG